MAAVHAPMKPAMQTVLLSDLEPTLADASVRGAHITVYGSLADAERVWREAVAGCACYVFQTFEWNSVWQNTIGRTQRVAPRVVHVAAADGRTLMLIPLGIYQNRFFSSLQFLGGDATDYNAPVIDRGFAGAVTANGFASLWHIILELMPNVDLVYLARMPETIEETPNPMVSLPSVRRNGTAFAAALPTSFAEFAAVRSADFFRQNRYKWRRLAKAGTVEVRFASDPAEREDIVRVAAEQKTEWLAHYGLPNLFGRPEVREFYKRLTHTRFPGGGIVVVALRVGQRIVATMWGARFRNRYCFLLSSYDGDWSRFSVGRLLMESVVQWCIAQGDIKVFDLTVGHEPYKLHWSDHVLPLHQQLNARTLKGAAVALYRYGRARLGEQHHTRSLVRAARRAFRIQPRFLNRRR